MTKKIISVIFLLFSFSYAQEFKAVFDCSSSDPRFVLTRLFLIERTAKDFKEDKLSYRFEITVHSGCVLFLKKKISDFPDSEKIIVQDIQNQLQILKEFYNVKIKACNMALNRYKIKKEEVLDFDFYGFPEKLYRIKYPVTGNPQLCKGIAKKIETECVKNRGLDYGV